MTLPRRILVLSGTLAAAGAGFGAAALQPGCGSNCGSDCPPTAVYIGNLDNVELPIADILVDGPACPPQYGVFCLGDQRTTSCTHVTITGQAEGTCDVLIVFRDRPSMIVRTEFGPRVQQGCCKGHSIAGDTVFVIPAGSDAGIVGLDGGTDSVRIHDGGADGAAPATDAGADADAAAADATAD